jgi:hypothetical protein
MFTCGDVYLADRDDPFASSKDAPYGGVFRCKMQICGELHVQLCYVHLMSPGDVPQAAPETLGAYLRELRNKAKRTIRTVTNSIGRRRN